MSDTFRNSLDLLYLLAAVLFIFGLKMLSQVKTARRGNLISSVGMLLAVITTLLLIQQNQLISLIWIVVAIAIGTIAGLLLAFKTPMTGMPQMVAMLNGFGGLASMLVACGDYFTKTGLGLVPEEPWHFALAVGLTVLVGSVTFTGSMIAFGKLQGLKITPGQPVLFRGQKPLNALLLVICAIFVIWLTVEPPAWATIPVIAVIALALGILLVIPIGGADMPVVICLLNSYSGIAGAFAGFVLHNMCLIITGSLVGASGLILTNIMCKAMNRSLGNVLFGGVGFEAAGAGATTSEKGTVRTFTIDDAVITFESASRVMVVPGYGMAVAQAQHVVREMADKLQQRGIVVNYAIHPVAGRMPGHMNVLLAEANVPYEQLLDLDPANAEFEQADVALVIGANDVTNPAARHDKASPIYGMPILDVDKARTIIVIKRSLNPGFAGVENELYFDPKCAMLFGDAKKVVTELSKQLGES
ncbi:MAG: NAD(P)(+) transhydrogenase (Re/Si-specific) subunit beta [Phycisphaeraceae bacterium]|nr:NAD(P)(+) transhydrogenase (Re/Si-specific) subunit beta [Phycisphaeraceae bacterium]